MIEEKSSIFVSTLGNYLSLKNGAVKVYCKETGKKNLVPLLNIGDIVITKGNEISANLIVECAERRIPISIVSATGKRLAGISFPESNRVVSRMGILEISRNENRRIEFSKSLLKAKINNYRIMMMKTSYGMSNESQKQKILKSIEKLRNLELSIVGSTSVLEIMGYEGSAAREYFGILPLLCSSAVGKRTRRPPLTSYDLVVSFFYGLAKNNYVSALEHYGLDPYVGIIHRSNPSRCSMALDLLEEMRWACDRLTITLFNKNILSANDDFITNKISGEVSFRNDSVRLKVMKEWIDYRGSKFKHYSKEEPVSLSEIPYRQVIALDKYATGVCAYYPWEIAL